MIITKIDLYRWIRDTLPSATISKSIFSGAEFLVDYLEPGPIGCCEFDVDFMDHEFFRVAERNR